MLTMLYICGPSAPQSQFCGLSLPESVLQEACNLCWLCDKQAMNPYQSYILALPELRIKFKQVNIQEIFLVSYVPANGIRKSVSNSEFGNCQRTAVPFCVKNLNFVSIRTKAFFACLQKVFVDIKTRS